ncbi:hypothetical protein [Ketogulonicigenium robustum]|nr:hypothetical protein [Ketogulonicigenium robustum]
MDHFLTTFFRFDFIPQYPPEILAGLWVTLRNALPPGIEVVRFI